MADKLMVVIPCYNEEEVLPETSRRLVEKMAALTQKGLISPDSRVLLVDDGSRDRTWELISALHRENPLFEGVKLSRNRGHQNALLAGLMTARGRCDMSISMDADLQDDMDAMDRFIEKYQEGCDVVYGVRNRRDTDTAFKRGTALMFYRLMKALGVDITYNHADYRLMSARALEALSQFGEVNLFLRGLAPLVGFQSDVVTYDRSERFAGESKYPFKKMLAFAIDGITSFSVKPLRLITTAGVIIFLISLLMLLYTLVSWIAGHAVLGWTSTLASIWLIGGSIILDTVFGFDVSSIITALGVGGIAISLGLQDTLSNLIGGLQLTFMHVISPGDHIRVGSDQGVVKDVGLRHTTIQNASGQIVIIPNSVLSKTSLVQMPPANVVSVPFAVTTGAAPLDEDAAQIAEAATKAVAQVSKVISDPPCLVRFTEITEYGFKGTATLKVEDPDLVSAALDAAVRAIAPFTR